MALHEDYNDESSFMNMSSEEDSDTVMHKKHVKKMLEQRLERKRLKEELEYFDGELDADFDWDYVDK